MFRPTKSFGEEMIFNSSAVNLGASLPAYSRKPSVYLPSRITPRMPAFNSRVAISAARMFSGVSIAGRQAAMFSAGPTLTPARPPAPIAPTPRPGPPPTRVRTRRKSPRPRDRKPVGPGRERFDQADVLLVAMIVIIGAVGVALIGDLARCMRENVPDRWAPAVFMDRALDLIGRRGSAPHKALGK